MAFLAEQVQFIANLHFHGQNRFTVPNIRNSVSLQTAFFIGLHQKTIDMKSSLFSFVSLFLGVCFPVGGMLAQSAPDTVWQKKIGGADYEMAYCIRNAGDGGYIIAAVSSTPDEDDNILVLKLNAQAAVEWQRLMGGSDAEEARTIEQTKDGGYILLGTSLSEDGDVTVNNGRRDVWVVKLNANGAIEWQRSIGSNADEEAVAIAQAPDNGFVVLGTALNGDEFSGDRNYIAAKLTAQGVVSWQKEFGGSGNDVAHGLIVTEDNEYILAGTSYSEDGDLPTTIVGDYVCWLVKVNTSGSILWSKCYDGENGGIISAAKPQPNRYSFLAIKGPSSNSYHWLFTIDKQGVVLSDTKHYFPRYHIGEELIRTADNGYIMTGFAVETDTAGDPTALGTWLVRFAADGSLVWQKKLLNDTASDSATYVGKSTVETTDGGFLVAGHLTYFEDTVGNVDVWLVKLGGTNLPAGVDEAAGVNETVMLYPNPATTTFTLEWQHATTHPACIRLYDILGKIVFSELLPQGTDHATLNLTPLPSGIYTLTSTEREVIRRFRLVKD
ncbi:T9SS type A sorting domain-containing protein [bacterium]|nr:MAG: T9SS type A sorting domain-containing protein [bacterium]